MKALGGFWQWCRERKCDGKRVGMKGCSGNGFKGF